MYAPFDDDSSRYAYHRTVYVFACRDGRCHRAAGTRRASQPPACVRVFRTQASETQIDEGEATAREDVATHASRSICVVCGLYGDKTCAECRNVCYCSKEHQKMHWTAGHKLACASASASAAQLQSTTSAISYGFPESLIDSADDDFEVRKLEELGETSMALVPARLDAPAPAAPWIGEEYEDDATCVDKAFLRFQKRIRFHPDQVLR